MAFRSLPMQHYNMIIPRDIAYTTFNALLTRSCVHVVDACQEIERAYYPQIRRCEELLGRIGVLRGEIRRTTDTMREAAQANHEARSHRNVRPHVQHVDGERPINGRRLQEPSNQPYARLNEQIDPINGQNDQEQESLLLDDWQELTNAWPEMEDYWNREIKEKSIESVRYLEYIQQNINRQWNAFRELSSAAQKIRGQLKSLSAKIACVEALQNLNEMQGREGGVGILAAVVDLGTQLRIEKTVYRVSRGYACVRTIEQFRFQGLSNFNQRVLVVIFPYSELLERKLRRILETSSSYLVNHRDAPKSNSQQLIKQHSDSLTLLTMNQIQTRTFLREVRQPHRLPAWRMFLLRQRLIYEALNKTQPRQSVLVAEFYIKEKDINKLLTVLNRLQPAPVIEKLAVGTPPTAFDETAYLTVPQQIVDTYGVPRYGQINPAVFTTVTFPFFFGVMFSDIAHGLVLLVTGLYLVFTFQQQQNPQNEPSDIQPAPVIEQKKSLLSFLPKAPTPFYMMRYMILMMGIAAVYCGFIYNDFIGMQMNFFGSCYNPPPQLEPIADKKQGHDQAFIFPDNKDCSYGFGLDPIWSRAENQLTYVNSLKMKISIVLGVLHMIFGICLKALNTINFKKKLDFIFEFIPQIIFMTLLFGYMVILIFIKWGTELSSWNDYKPEKFAPSIITTMMNIGLKMGKTIAILLIAVFCVFFMLFPKPLIEARNAKKVVSIHELPKSRKRGFQSQITLLQQRSQRGQYNQIGSSASIDAEHQQDSNHQKHSLSQLFVHQLIETIEFALGAVSNTASYLRLWALSLAHQQLSKVFFTYTLEKGYTGQSIGESFIFLIFGYYMLGFITFGIIICMDTMECFLHALRLHWVEFQNKFYKGDGYRWKVLGVSSVKE